MKLGLMVACWIGVLASTTGCGDDGTSSTDSNGSMGGSGSATTSATDSEGSTDTGESSASESTGELMAVCADGQACDPGDVCVAEIFDPPCQNYDPETEECPPDTTATSCGGPGAPCCCGPADPTVYTCLTPTSCSGTADCECLGDICGGSKICEAIASTSGGTFRCASEKPA